MLYFICSLAFGIIQMLFLNTVLKSIISGNLYKAIGILMLKLICYGGGIALAVLVFKDNLNLIISGFIVGLPLSAIIYFCSKLFTKKNLS